MKAKVSISMPAAWFLLFLCSDVPIQHDTLAQAFVLPSGPLSTRTTTFPALAMAAKEEDEEDSISNNTRQGAGVGRRGTLMTLLGTAASFVAGDIVLDAAAKATTSGAAGTAAIQAGAGGVYERVIAFGSKFRGSAIASEDLTAWVASQNVAQRPELAAWVKAQRKLHQTRKAAVATAAATRVKTTRRAAVAGGSVLEEGFLAAAAAAAVNVFTAPQVLNATTTENLSLSEKNETSPE